MRFLRCGGDAAEPVGLESGGSRRGGGVRAGYVAKELEGLAAEPAAELVRDDEDGVALSGCDYDTAITG